MTSSFLRASSGALLFSLGIVAGLGATLPDADRQTPAQLIGPGLSPDLAIDPVGRKIHLVYRLDNRLLYRIGDLAGRFAEPEVIFESPSDAPSLWDPRIALDRDQALHVVVADGHYHNRFTWYTNRIGGRWKPPLAIFDKETDQLNRATMPHLAIEPDGSAAFVGAFTVGGADKSEEEKDKWGILARVENLATTPAVVRKNRILPWNPQFALIDGELWVGGRNIRVPNRLFALQRFDKRTLEPIGEPLPLSGGRHGEIGRMSIDANGDIHAAGTLNNPSGAETAGWYNTLARARAGLPALNYLTSNRNACGAGRPVCDARTPGRVYVVHWHGAEVKDFQPRDDSPGNHLHYVRFEDGVKHAEGRKISDHTQPHGNAYRHTPAAVAHPDGGMVVIVQESGEPNRLHLVTVGVPTSEKPRLAVLTDIGGDPDDQQSLIRLMVYANEFEIELLLASAVRKEHTPEGPSTRIQLIREIVEAYGAVRPNLLRHAGGWPSVDTLRDTIVSGNVHYGRAHVGEGHDSEGSQALLKRIGAGSPERPLNIVLWGGQTDLAQALWRSRQTRGPDEWAAWVKKFRVYDIADQDNIADWMRSEFPGMFYILSKAPAGRDRRTASFRGMYLTGDESLTRPEWIEQHVRGTGPLGALYPMKTWTAPNPHGCLKEGDTPSWFFFLPLGGNDPRDPTRPGWGGQYRREPDGWYVDLDPADGVDPRDTVSRWRPDFQGDFARRMNWCRPSP